MFYVYAWTLMALPLNWSELPLDVPVLGLVALLVGIVGLALALLMVGGIYAVIVLVEALVLRWLQWAPFRRCLKDAMLMNLATTVLGGVIYGLLIFTTDLRVLEPLDLALSFVLSVLIEAGILVLSKRQAGRQVWPASLAANVLSYAGLFLLVVLLEVLGSAQA
jgi:hypothetical protein